MNRTFKVALAAGAATVALAACTNSSTDGTPTPATNGVASQTKSSSTTSGKPSNGDDLNISRFADKPCDLIKPDQLTALGNFRPGESSSAPLGPGCSWFGVDALKDTTFFVTLVTKGDNLESMAENAKSFPIFKRTTIAGREAYSADRTDGKASCSTAVSTSAKDAIFVQGRPPANGTGTADKSCQASEKVAAIVIGNLKG
ncbi:DUF3558 domain-containing protein [Saccharothrix violaceirubra]|uniref:DUF3558 domain-containing protein n=1 Tax=Saccharothrix violaceirubra TaxID=413306 RepID=A0A7W7T8Q8_9PSEU|nr:DUF3558 domain-containing protein [Saccharothrix violaceirubra]MBB4968052.1 hypothetical protein [Saccharothrix violaceirubra]